MKIVLLSGSTVGTKTKTAMTYLYDHLKLTAPDHDLVLLDLKDYDLPFSDGRNYLDYPGDAGFVTAELMAADIILIGSPTFQASIPATLKNIFDLLPQNALDRKIVGIVMTAGSPKHFLVAETQLKPIIHYMKGTLVSNYVFIEDVNFYQQTITNDDVTRRLHKLAEDSLVLAKTYQAAWQEQEDSYGF
ncbi:NADPH-dependent FMN reductase [Vagococcus fessus]|uniref:FMN reductase n=1 Tax=Vagococcus fessus TaxID=120370 RepID=A0A430A7F6_9ENTE|nr:NADPH-dependent FMN reductase [Vagococcus fessus]RSU03040.1 FMN reductase [Vagococcus fessus]